MCSRRMQKGSCAPTFREAASRGQAHRWPTFEGRNLAILLECVRHPRRTGAVASTPRRCAEAFIDRLAIEDARHVVELGAGTGVITSALRHRLPSTALLLSVEISSALATQLRAKHAADNVEVVCGSAAELITILNDRRITASTALSAHFHGHLCLPRISIKSCTAFPPHSQTPDASASCWPPTTPGPQLADVSTPYSESTFPTFEKNGHTGRIYHRSALITAERRQ